MSSRPRPEFHFDANQYERPNDTWVCGRAADGIPCPLGPSETGQCSAVCTPYQLAGRDGGQGDRWYCANASALSGKCDEGPLSDGVCGQFPAECRPSKKGDKWVCNRGLCQDGPLPGGRCSQRFVACRPVRSVLAKRKRVSFTVFALTLGALAAAVCSPIRREVVSPGRLSSHHSADMTCADCHSAGDGNVQDWLTAAFTAHGEKQDERCLRCHEERRPHATRPHGCDAAVLADATERARRSDTPLSTSDRLLYAAANLAGRPDTMACATCHQDHRGPDFDLTAMTDVQCQSCHANQFHGFAEGHPDFSNYCYARRTRLYFNHSTHYGIHFSDYKRIMPGGHAPADKHNPHPMADGSCAQCHEPDPSGDTMALRGFEHSCASCHARQITDDAFDAIEVIRIPRRVVVALGHGDPAANENSKESDEVLTPFMQVLLESDPTLQAALEELQSIPVRGSNEITPEQRSAADVLRTAAVQLLTEVGEPGRHGVRRRLAAALGSSSDETDGPQLARSLSFESPATQLKERLLSTASGAGSADQEAPSDTASTDENEQNGPDNPLQDGDRYAEADVSTQRGWLLGDNGWSIRYRPLGHADPFLTLWIETIANYSADPQSTGRLTSAAESTVVDQLFRSLTDPLAAGRCMKCHTADEIASGQLQVNWTAYRPSLQARGFTKFSHGPHVTSPSDKNSCVMCHELSPESDLFLPEFLGPGLTIRTNPSHVETSGFSSVAKHQCATCHQPHAASHRCLTCHNYHVNHDGL